MRRAGDRRLGSEDVPARGRAVLQRLHAPGAWPHEAGPLTAVEVHADDGVVVDVDLRFAGPRPVRLRVEVTRSDDGIAWTLLEGDATMCTGTLRITGEVLAWSYEVALPATVPTTLWREWDEITWPRWLEALAGP